MEGTGFQAPSSPGKDVAMANRQSWRGSYSTAFFLWTWGLLLAGWNPGLHFCKEKPADSHILHWPRPMALHLFGLFWTPRGFFFGGVVVVGVLLRADGFQVSWSGPGESSQAWFGARVQDAAVCAIINLHLLTGSGGAAVSACGPRTRDWLREGERGWGPLGRAGPGPISLS